MARASLMIGLAVLLCFGSAAVSGQSLSLNFQNVPYSRWLTKINSSCLMLNCHVLGPPGWEISYQIRHRAYSCAQHPGITPDRKGSLIICNMDENRHHGQYRCEASNSQGSRAYKEITVTRSAIRRFRSGLLEQYTGLVEPISCRREPAPFIEITDLRTLNRQQRGQRYQYCIEVRCTATGHPEPLSYRFRYKEIAVPSPFLHRGITVSGNVLTHCNTSLANLGGSYTCTASNSLPRSVSKSIDVTVAAPVENFVRVVHFTRTSSPQGCTTFNCQVDGAPQPLTYRMTYNRGSLPPGFTSLSQTSFRYCGPSLPGGTYRCSASNRHGSRAFKDITIQSTRRVQPTPASNLREESASSYGIHLSMDEENCLVVKCTSLGQTRSTQHFLRINGRNPSLVPHYQQQVNGDIKNCDVDYNSDSGLYQCTAYPSYKTYRKQVSASELREMMSTPVETTCDMRGVQGELATAQSQLRIATQENRDLRAALQALQDQMKGALQRSEQAATPSRLAPSEDKDNRASAALATCENKLSGVRSLVRPCQ